MNLEKYLWNYLVKQGQKLEETNKHCYGCGSCRYYDFSYESQLEGKRQWVAHVMAENAGYSEEITIEASPKTKYYRGRMDFVATKGMIGMRRSGGFNKVYDVENSCIYDENIGEILTKLRKFKKFPDYDLVTHEGVIRYFVTRKTRHNEVEQYLLSVVVTEIKEDFVDSLKSFLKDEDLWEYFTVICIILQPSKADLSYGEVSTYLKGLTLKQDLKIDKKIVTLDIGPQSFFQANTVMFEKVLEYMSANLAEHEYTYIYDLYGGVGSIGIALATSKTILHMAENNPENTILFEANCKQNNIASREVFEGTVAEFLDNKEFEKDNLVIFDPPRIGLEEKVARKFLTKKNLPNTLIYMSCNPVSQATDLKILSEKYNIQSIKAFDMFPYASHIETVAILRLR